MFSLFDFNAKMITGVLKLICLLVGALCVTLVGTRVFRKQAIKRGLVANPNYRSLHQKPTASGGGVVFALIFVLLSGFLFATHEIGIAAVSMFAFGGLVALTFGFADDVFHLGQAEKLLVQCALAAWVLYWSDARPLVMLPAVPTWVGLLISWIGLIWLMNLYNFVDGIDGLAASGAVFLCAVLALALALGNGDKWVIVALALLGTCAAGFLVDNWPPASVFMGDAGSLFLGYCFGAFMAITVTKNQLSVWTWLVALGYFVGDTTTTTILRMITMKDFYRPHRSHAYQNLARISGSHLRVVGGVTLYHLFWLGPLVVWSVLEPTMAWLAALLGVIPSVLWAWRFGPRMSRD